MLWNLHGWRSKKTDDDDIDSSWQQQRNENTRHDVHFINCVHREWTNPMTSSFFVVFIFLLAVIGCVEGFLPSSLKAFRRQSHNVAMTVSPTDTFALLFDCDGVIVETGTHDILDRFRILVTKIVLISIYFFHFSVLALLDLV